MTTLRRCSREMRALFLFVPLVFTACGGGDTTAPVVTDAVSTLVLLGTPSQFMVRGTTQQVTAEARGSSGNVLTGRTIAWESSNASVASVTSGGLVTALAAGVTTIKATTEGRSASFPVQVSESVSEVTVISSQDIFEAGMTHQLTARVRDGNGATVPNATLTWNSMRTSVATVSSTGLLTIVGTDNDSMVVTAAFGGKSGRFRFFAWPNLPFDEERTIAAQTNTSRWFLLKVPAGTGNITVSTVGGSGDGDLFVWTPGTWASATQMCSSESTTNEESCTLVNPQSGLWSIEVFAYEQFENVKLVAVRNQN